MQSRLFTQRRPIVAILLAVLMTSVTASSATAFAHSPVRTQSASAASLLAEQLSAARAVTSAGWEVTSYTALTQSIDAAQAVHSSASATDAERLAQARALRAARLALVKTPAAGSLPDGYWEADIALLHASKNQASMGDAGIEHAAVLYVRGASTGVHMNMQQLKYGNLAGYLSELSLMTQIGYNSVGYPVSYTRTPVTVLSTFDVVDAYNGPNAADTTLRNKPYPKKLVVPVTYADAYTWVYCYVPIMGELASGEQIARLSIDKTTVSRLEVDTDALITALARARSIGTSSTPALPAAALAASIDAAQAALTAAGSYSQATVDAAAVALQACCDAIRATSQAPAPAALTARIATAKQRTAGGYSADSFGLLADAITAAEHSAADTLSTQYELDARLRALDVATARLEPISSVAEEVNTQATKPADKTKLKALITKAGKVKKGTYTTATYTTLRTALKAAKQVYADTAATQSAVDSAYKTLNVAYKGLMKPTTSASTVSKSTMTDGRYQVRVDFWHAQQDKASMGNPALNHTALIDVSGGGKTLKISLSMKQLQVGSVTTSLGTLQYKSGSKWKAATVIARNLPGNKPSAFRFTLPNKNTYQPVLINPQVEAMGNKAVEARLRIDWQTLVRVASTTALSTDVSVATGQASTTTTTTGSALSANTTAAPTPVINSTASTDSADATMAALALPAGAGGAAAAAAAAAAPTPGTAVMWAIGVLTALAVIVALVLVNRKLRKSRAARAASLTTPVTTILLPVLVLAAALTWAPTLARAAEARDITAMPSYKNPVTGIVEDTGSDEALGQSMTESVVKSQAQLLIDDADQTFVTLTFALTDNFRELEIRPLDAAGAAGDPLGISIVSEDTAAHTEDVQLLIPDLNTNLRVSLFSVPMDRTVVFFLSFQEAGEQTATDSGSDASATAPAPAADANEGLSVYENSSKEVTAQAVSGAARNNMLLFIGVGAAVVVVFVVVGVVIARKRKS
ncbi:MAG: NEAT domain-containing protein [Actinomycetes bacterium]|jgi:hypothetical protein|nr:NEAT domain-containing protein [Actinomycetes bacterium]